MSTAVRDNGTAPGRLPPRPAWARPAGLRRGGPLAPSLNPFDGNPGLMTNRPSGASPALAEDFPSAAWLRLPWTPPGPPLDPARHTADDIVTTASPDDIVTWVCRVTRVPRLSSEQYAVPYAVPYAVLFTELAGVAPVQPALFRIGFDVRRACSNPQHASGPRSGELHHAGSGVCRGRSACGAAQPAGAGGSAGLTT